LLVLVVNYLFAIAYFERYISSLIIKLNYSYWNITNSTIVAINNF